MCSACDYVNFNDDDLALMTEIKNFKCGQY